MAILILIFILIGGGSSVIAALVIAWSLLHPPRMTDGKAMYRLRRLSPEDLGIPFTSVSFDLADAARTNKTIRIAGWWMPAAAPSPRTVILIHGYADAKVGAIAWAKPWRESGINILAIDLRAHGESGGEICTGGYFESNDVEQIIEQLKQLHPAAAREIISFGISLGAIVAMRVAKGRPGLVNAIAIESPFISFRHAVRSHLARFGTPPFITSLATRFAEMFSGAKFHELRIDDLFKSISIPTLIVQSGRDSLVSQADQLQIETLSRPHDHITCWTVVAAAHLEALAVAPAEYREHLQQLISQIKSPELLLSDRVEQSYERIK